MSKNEHSPSKFQYGQGQQYQPSMQYGQPSQYGQQSSQYGRPPPAQYDQQSSQYERPPPAQYDQQSSQYGQPPPAQYDQLSSQYGLPPLAQYDQQSSQYGLPPLAQYDQQSSQYERPPPAQYDQQASHYGKLAQSQVGQKTFQYGHPSEANFMQEECHGNLYRNQTGISYQNSSYDQLASHSQWEPASLAVHSDTYCSGNVGSSGCRPPNVSEELWEWFQSVDVDHSNEITAQELQQALINSNWSHFNNKTCRLMIGMFDKDRNGKINIHEFASLYKYIKDWKNCFDRYDRDKSGNIDSAELAQAFKEFGYNLSPQFSHLVVSMFDCNGFNAINLDHFIHTCVMLNIFTDKFRCRDVHMEGIITISYEDVEEEGNSGDYLQGIQSLQQNMTVTTFYNFFPYYGTKCHVTLCTNISHDASFA